jgi:hypothetical protein
MSWLRRQTPPPPAPERTPHPDSRVEAELQRVLSMQRAAERIERRLDDIRGRRSELEDSASRRANSGSSSIAKRLMEQSAELRKERDDLEAQLPAMHDEISRRLAALGEDALMLYGPS